MNKANIYSIVLTIIFFIYGVTTPVFAQIESVDTIPGIDIVEDYEDLINVGIKVLQAHQSLVFIDAQPVQSLADEFGGVFLDNGIIFASEEKLLGYTVESTDEIEASKTFDLFYIPFDGTTFGIKKKLIGDVNTPNQEGPVHLFNYNNRMLFTQGYLDEDLNKYKLRTMLASTKDGKKWTTEKQILPNFKGSVAHATLSQSEEIMVFSATLDERYGKPDLYYTIQNEKGEWNEPKRFSSEVNTEGREVFPTFYTNDDLFFSSDGHPDTLGGLDFYALNIDDITNPIIKHLGTNINTPYDEYCLRFSPDNTLGMFSSNRSNKGDDLYIFKVEDSMIRDFVAVGDLYIYVKHLITEDVINGSQILIQNMADGIVLFDQVLTGTDHCSFSLDLTIPQISISVKHDKFHAYYETISVPNLYEINEVYNIYLDPDNTKDKKETNSTVLPNYN